jgi:hypothetical protein
VVVVAACKGMVRHGVHFHEHSKATLGIQKFKTWNSGRISPMAGTVQFGWDGITRLSHASTCSKRVKSTLS